MAVGVSVFSAVVEQTRQLGLRRAVGATRRSLVADVVGEVTCAGLVGAVLGVLVGWTIARSGLRRAGVEVVVPPLILAIGVGIAVVAATLAAVLPAIRVARIQPVEALRAGNG
jgi:ABC-type antimicrobial peptide transport system permease subunit